MHPAPGRRVGGTSIGALVLLAFAALAAIRLLTAAREPWGWDEVLFTLAVRDGLDLGRHHPHAPGYPLFVELGRAVTALGVEPYRALALVGAAGSVLAAAALFALLRSLEVPRDAALFAGALYAFIPSVWLFGVRGYADAPGAAAFLGAAAGLIAAARNSSRIGLAAGLVLAAVAAGLRPQNAVPLAPLLALALARALRSREGRRTAAIGVAGAAIVSAAVWAPAVVGSGGIGPLLSQVSMQAADTRLHAMPTPAELLSAPLWIRWLVDPFGTRALFLAVAAAALAGAAAQPRRAAWLALVFAPWIALVVPFCAPFAAPRYAAVPLACVAGLAALALDAARRVPVAPALAAAALLEWTAGVAEPSVERVAHHNPPSLAMRALAFPAFAHGAFLHDPALRMHAELAFPARARGVIVTDRPVTAAAGDVVVAADRPWPGGAPTWTSRVDDDPVLRRIGDGTLLRVELGRVRAPTPVGLRAGAARPVRYDETLPVSVDAPAHGARVRGELMVSGWCQERGGGAIAPAEARIDGRVVAPLRVERTPRPDVARVVPEIGDAARAGYVLVLDASGIEPGPHALTMSFRARDGRERVLEKRAFVWER